MSETGSARQDPGPVVVGVDGSVVSEQALLWAAEHAYRIGADLRVVLVRTHPVPVTAVAPAPVWPWPVVHQRNEQDVAKTSRNAARDRHRDDPSDLRHEGHRRRGRWGQRERPYRDGARASHQ